ncbi:MAG: site-specific DNA-methyltransferase [Elusimicrobia bacterium]|nr:site-specific DNA-methyltransferase [Elusimicrobiota bacterium]
MPVIQFKGKTAVETYHHTVAHHTLDFSVKLSVLDKGEKPNLEGNLIIEGDNLLALKALLPTHAGKIKCIYIDPPYNTGDEGWVYNDNLTQPQFKEWIGQTVGKEGEDATRHDKWCCMMYPRLQLLKELLSDAGAIVIHIDENEIANLEKLLDEIFGEENFLGTIIWDKRNPKGDAQGVASQHESILVVAKNKEAFFASPALSRSKRNAKAILNKAKELFGQIGKKGLPCDLQELNRKYKFPSELVQKYSKTKTLEDINEEFTAWLKKQEFSGGEMAYDQIDGDGDVYQSVSMAWPNKKEAPAEYFRPLIHPRTKKPCPVPRRGWRSPPVTMNKLLENGEILFGSDESTQPRRKYLLKNNTTENVPSLLYFGGSDDDLLEAMGISFDNPKPIEVAKELIRSIASPKQDIVLDSCAGSGTAAQAVLELNKEDGGNRKFILVQQAYDTKENEKEKFNICEKITAERVRRVIHGYSYTTAVGKKEKVEGLGGSFTYAHVGKPLFGEYHNFGKELPSYEDLAKYVFYTETSQEFDRKALDEKTGKIGERGGVSYYLLYSPNGSKGRALDMDWLGSLKDKNKNLVVYCEKLWAHRSDLAEYERKAGRNVRVMTVPMQLK